MSVSHLIKHVVVARRSRQEGRLAGRLDLPHIILSLETVEGEGERERGEGRDWLNREGRREGSEGGRA